MSVVGRERARPMKRLRPMTFTIRAAECMLECAPTRTTSAQYVPSSLNFRRDESWRRVSVVALALSAGVIAAFILGLS